MASSLGTHFPSFMFLFPLGIRRLVSSSSIYLNNNPSLFRWKIWYFSSYPTTWSWKNVEFFLFLVALPIASFSHFFLFLAFSGHPTNKISFLQQSLVVFLFWVLLIFIGIKQFLDPIAMPDHFVFVFAGVVFFIEYLMNGKGLFGLAQLDYSFLGGLTLVCAAACFFLSIRPSESFHLSLLQIFLLSAGLVLKGTWALQVGLSLYTDAFAFKGCGQVVISSSQGNTDVKCDLEEDKLRGMALMNLLFVRHLVMVLIMCFVLLGLVGRVNKVRSSDPAQLESDLMLMRPLPPLDME